MAAAPRFVLADLCLPGMKAEARDPTPAIDVKVETLGGPLIKPGPSVM
jgi:hypothetical protein